ncbi:uncharacterized protein VDAG_05223 [Verticillium dahliae VdLs.17]|uniref:Uncharacterized protein n=1 Tax=Verticillium dahliae (strain VdLs.17 / ATCC MYA-4575 / FGSC 10137) TaxID=498257 RepID=G2X4Z1_VERDV|nr:uncharacterized protein VDAG_05223 [Verticillium dahliae VdLs.17]EGY23785.1 hypothetical protein VDAG_05223 [Verticillium dahliae VdLs.17]
MIATGKCRDSKQTQQDPYGFLSKRRHMSSQATSIIKNASLYYLICQHHWNRDFDPERDRWSAYGARFGYPNRRCYILLDYGQSADNEVPVLWYEWMGKSFNILAQDLPPEIQVKLKEYPFMRPSIQDMPKRPTPDAIERRQIIRTKLRSEISLSDSNFQFIREHQGHAEWLQTHVESRFWAKFESLVNLREKND